MIRSFGIDTFAYKVLSLVLNHRASKLGDIATQLEIMSDNRAGNISFRILQSRGAQTQFLPLRRDRIPNFLYLMELFLFRRAC